MTKTKQGWANRGFIILLVLSVFIVIPLCTYVQDNPSSFVGKFIALFSRLIGQGKAVAADRIVVGAVGFLFLTITLVWSFILIPIEMYGDQFWQGLVFQFKSINPKHKTTRFGWHYGIAKSMLKALKEGNGKISANAIQKRIEKMQEIDPDSPFIKEVIGELYSITMERVPDTPISSELKQWEGLSGKVREYQEADKKAQEKSSISVGVAILFMVTLIFIGVMASVANGKVSQGIIMIVLGIIVFGILIKRKSGHRKK